ncbi:unnamed protein product [Closterium sp. Naga37s-1]|nr:unnamed protein product [Closterium sp. Naga37s-1]
MGRPAAALFVILLCAALFTVAASAASAIAPFLPHAKPLVKGKTVIKYMGTLHPTKINGKVVGDKGASGKIVMKGIRYASTSYASSLFFQVLNIASGGEPPSTSFGASCIPNSFEPPLTKTWVEVTSSKSARRKRYSFIVKEFSGAKSLAEVRSAMGEAMASGKFIRVNHTNNKLVLCGKLTKVI